MTETNCVIVHRRDPDRARRAVDGGYICQGCRKGLAFDLLDLPGMYDRLTERHTARTGGHSEIRSGGHAGLNLNDNVARARGNIYTGLSGWARIVSLELGRDLPDDNVRSIAAYLIGYKARTLDWICAQPWAEEALDTFDVLHREAFPLLYPSGRRRFELPATCIPIPRNLTAAEDDPDIPKEQIVGGCGSPLMAMIADVADMLPSRIWCPECGVEIPADRWITYGRRVHKAMGVSA